jgi:hypothetical protein
MDDDMALREIDDPAESREACPSVGPQAGTERRLAE